MLTKTYFLRTAFYALATILLITNPMLYAGDGDNNFLLAYTDSRSDTIIDSNTRDIVAGSDLDQDGKYEIIVTDYDNGGRVHVFEVIGDNTYEYVWKSPGTPSTDIVPAREVKTGDLDNDGLGEILLSISKNNAPYDSSGIYVYEWDGVHDNGYVFVAVIPIDLSLTSGFTEDFIVGDIDGDDSTEVIFLNNGPDAEDNCYIISISGTFETTWSQQTEATFTRAGGSFYGSPYDVVVADLDGDSHKEIIVSVQEDAGGLFIAESTGPDTYVASTYILVDTTGSNNFSLESMATADFNSDGADELFIVLAYSGQLAVVTGGNDVSKITFENNVRILRTGGAGHLGMAIGDQDHGSGSDGPDIYVSHFGTNEVGGYIQDFEFTGTDIFDPVSYTEHVIYQDTEIFQPAGLFQLDAPQVDLDGDGKRELLLTYTGESPNGIQLRIFEFDPVPASLTLSSPNGGETWDSGTVQNISWSSEHFIGGMNIEYSTDGGSNWKEVISYTANDGSYDWSVPNDPSSSCLVRISKMAVGSPFDVSDALFAIATPKAAITFVIDDAQFQEITDCLLKGSWDVNGNYDPNWSSGEQQMYDDGTHGNQVAGDHRWTLQLYLVVDFGANTWGWGAFDSPGGSWLIEGANQQFTLPDNSPQTLIYVREGYSTPCTGVNWTLDDLVANSGGIVTGTFPNYVTQKTIVVCASDKLSIAAGSTLKFVKGDLRIFGTLEVQGLPGNLVTFTSNAVAPAPNDWATLHFKAGSGGSVAYAKVEYAHNGIWCDFGGPSSVVHSIFDKIGYDGALIVGIASGEFNHNVISNCGWSGMSLFNSSTQLRNNMVFNIGRTGIQINNGTSSDIDSNIVYNSTYDGIALYNSSPNIRYNLIYNNNDEGIDCSGSSPNIINNTIDNNGLNPSPPPPGYYTAGIECGESSAPVIKNNIITNNSHIGIHSGGGSAPQISYNDIWGYTVAAYLGCSAGTGDISEDPRYVAPGSANYHLQNTSPCIDAGDPGSPLDPDGTRADMGAYYYDQGPGVMVVIPDTTGQPGTWINIPIRIMTDVTGKGILSAEIELDWSPTVLDNASAASGTMAPGWSLSYNSTPGSGQMSIWMAGTEGNPPTDDLRGTGTLVMLTFKVVGQHCDTTTIHFDKMIFNEGNPPANTHDGLFHSFAGWDITGHIYYCLNNDPVDDVIVPAVGTLYSDATDVNGDYELLDLPEGDYVVKPEKENDLGTPTAISAYDAAWILQYGVGLRTFTPCQMIAADVSGNGSVSAFDAARILQWGVGIITYFPVMPDPTHFWRFVPDDFTLTMSNWMTAPDTIAYTPLNSDVVDNYKAILYGDVSGNWHPTDGGLAKATVSIVDIRLEDVYGQADDKISLPLNVKHASNIIAMSFTLQYDPQVLKAIGASPTSLTQDYLIAHNIREGQIKVALAGSQPIVGSGAIVNLEFEVLDTESTDAGSLLEITELVINEGSIAANVQSARFELGSPVPDEYALHQNYPNPFNPETTIKYQLPKSGKVVLKIYNTLGQEIRTLVNEENEAGYHEARWNGRDDNGVSVSSGIYIYQIQVGDFVSSKKMVFMM